MSGGLLSRVPSLILDHAKHDTCVITQTSHRNAPFDIAMRWWYLAGCLADTRGALCHSFEPCAINGSHSSDWRGCHA